MSEWLQDDVGVVDMADEGLTRDVIERESFGLRQQLRDLNRQLELELESYPAPTPEQIQAWRHNNLSQIAPTWPINYR